MEDEEIDWLFTVGKLILFQREFERLTKHLTVTDESDTVEHERVV